MKGTGSGALGCYLQPFSCSNYGSAGLLRPHLRDPVTVLAPFRGSHLIPLFTLPVSAGELCPKPQPQRVSQWLSHPTLPGPAPAPAHPAGGSSKRNLIRFFDAPASLGISPFPSRPSRVRVGFSTV